MIKRRRSSQSSPPLRYEINVTPFVDVMLVLLIIFMVAAPMSQVSVPVNLPQGGSGSSDEACDPVVISLDGQERIFLQEQEVTPEQLIEGLKALPPGSASKIYLRGDKQLPYNAIMTLMNRLSAHGFSKVNLVVEKAQ